jgi:hypothetical protein
MPERSRVRRWHLGAGVALATLELLVPCQVFGQRRGAAEPSIAIATLHDDNLFSSLAAPEGDRILRISPAVLIRQKWVRGFFSGSYGFDSEHYSRHRRLTTPLARTRAISTFHYGLGERLTLDLDNTYVDTNTPSELNTNTALAAARMRVRRIGAGVSVRYRLSLRWAAVSAYRATADRPGNGHQMSVRVGTAEVQGTLTRRDLLVLDYEGSQFGSPSAASTASQALRVGWIRRLGERTRLDLRSGLRVTSGLPSLDLRAMLNHQRETSQGAISYEQTQTTVVAHPFPVTAQSLQARGQWSPVRSLTSSLAAGLFRSTYDSVDVTVFRIGLGTQYSVTRLVAIDFTYGADTQRGAASLSERTAGHLRHRTVSLGLTTRWGHPRETLLQGGVSR